MTEKKETVYQEQEKSIPKNINQKPVGSAKSKVLDKKNEIKEEKIDNTQPQENIETKKSTEKQKTSKKDEPKIKKYEAISLGYSLPISKKHGMYICSFIKNKKIDKAITDLNFVVLKKKAVPFKGEIPHRKGLKGSGRYPVKASKYFINLLKSLKGNAIVNGLELENVVIYFASTSWASRQLRSRGRLAKRSNVILKAKELLTKGGRR